MSFMTSDKETVWVFSHKPAAHTTGSVLNTSDSTDLNMVTEQIDEPQIGPCWCIL